MSGDFMSSHSNTPSVKVFFEPESVAIVGASNTPGKFGYFLLKNLMDMGFKGRIYPVNPNLEATLGLKAFPTVNSIPFEVDLSVIIVPAVHVPEIMRDCAKKHVKGVVICSSGFRELGSEGARREQEIAGIARESGMRVVGPNTTGILNTANNFTTTFIPIPKPKRGPVAFIAQTGLFAAATLYWIVSTQNFGLSKVAGLGNKCDVDDSDILDYLAEDEETKVIAIYMEGIDKGRRFLETAERVSKAKPLVILKAGKSEVGMKAASSHTGSLSVNDRVFDAVCKRARIIRVENLEELVDVVKAFAYLPIPRGNRVAIISFTGAGGVMSADSCSRYGLSVTDLSENTLTRLQSNLPSWGRAGNPIDAEPLFERVGAESSIRLSLEAALEDDRVDCVSLVLVSMPVFGFDISGLISEFKLRYPEKPIVVHIIGLKESVDSHTRKLEEIGVPVYPSIERGIAALSALYRYGQVQRRKPIPH